MNYKGKVTLQRVRLNSGGYTSQGYYFGHGLPLFWYCTDEKHDAFTDGYLDGYFRAESREDAKAKVKAFPLMSECRFYR